jgi:transaldolase
MATKAINERLARLTSSGTSVWLDELSRGMLDDGELGRMVDEYGLRGMTSNPAIFEKAILASRDYEDALAAASAAGRSAEETYRMLVVEDVRRACDALAPVHEATQRLDGYVSLEVAPRLAHDPRGTLVEARELWGLVDRPNLMIKIPATEAGVAAVEQALFEGMNVNVTLLFGVERYRQVMEAYIAAMERRREVGLPLECRSVASFFVSRVDTEVDRRLAQLGRDDLRGRAGLANARAAYAAFQETFHGARFAALRAAGCPLQRPLWASTGVKDPAYPATMYVYGLAGPDTVNTMPRATLLAAAEEGEVRGAPAALNPQPDLDAIRQAGVSLEDVTEGLLAAGVDLFEQAMNRLLTGIASKLAQHP